MTPQGSDFIPVPLGDFYKYVKVVDGHYVTENQKGPVQIIIWDNNGNPFVVTLHKLLLTPDLCYRLFFIIMLMDLVHTCLFQKGTLVNKR